MRNIVLIGLAIIYTQYSFAQSTINTRKISRYTIINNGLKQEIKNYIQYERQHCKEYSIDLILFIHIKKIDFNNIHFSISACEREMKNDYLLILNDVEIMYSQYQGHTIFVVGNYKQTPFFEKKDESIQIPYSEDMKLLFYDPPYTTIEYEYKIKKDEFIICNIYRDEIIYK